MSKLWELHLEMASYKISIGPITWLGSLRQREYLERLDVYGRIIIQGIFKKCNWGHGLDWSDWEYGQVENTFKCGNEHPGPQKAGNFFLTSREPLSFSRRTLFLLHKYNVGCRFNRFCSPAPRNRSTECEIGAAFILGTSALQCVRSAYITGV